MLDAMSEVTDEGRVFIDGAGVRRLDEAEREQVLEAYGRYLETIPEAKRAEHETFYEVKDVVGGPASASAAPGCRPTACSSRATTKPTKMTSSCR